VRACVRACVCLESRRQTSLGTLTKLRG